MTAAVGTASNVFTGQVQQSNVTNTYAGYFTSGGSAFNLITPWQADQFQWWRYTGFGTAGIIGSGVWFRDFPAAAELESLNIVDSGVTGNHNNVLDTTNGITIANVAGGFPILQKTITGITTATPAVVTSAAHGLVTGQRVVITKVVGTMASFINDNTYVVQVLSANTFALYDVFGIPITTLGAYTSGGQFTLAGPDLGIQNTPISYQLTLGSAVVGSASDVVYFVATKFNAYFNLGAVTTVPI